VIRGAEALSALEFTEMFHTSCDGLKLYARRYGSWPSRGPVILCLPGLARTTLDFDVLAPALASHPERPFTVLCLDYRGRGQSDYDPDPSHYDLSIELADIRLILAELNIKSVIVIGTSRGGLHGANLALCGQGLVQGLVLNDIGPVIEHEGLLRIKGYVGKHPQASTLEEAKAALIAAAKSQFPAFKDEDWVRLTNRTYKENPDGTISPRYDNNLAKTLESIDLDSGIPPMWPIFNALGDLPILVVRGALSDILSQATVEEMKQRKSSVQSLTIEGQGHAPILDTQETIAALHTFASNVSKRSPQPKWTWPWIKAACMATSWRCLFWVQAKRKNRKSPNVNDQRTTLTPPK
jgi:pimeloyl-ACP methyl ester carboxylesterase